MGYTHALVCVNNWNKLGNAKPSRHFHAHVVNLRIPALLIRLPVVIRVPLSLHC